MMPASLVAGGPRPALLHELLSRSAEARPDATALVMGSEALSYGELERLSRRFASLLHQLGCRAGDRVCLVAEKSPRTVAALLGALEAGCVYVPIDPAGAPVRVAGMIADSEPGAIVADSSARGLLERLAHTGGLGMPSTVVALEAGLEELPRPFVVHGPEELPPSDAAVSLPVRPGHAAQILFTSGSTGRPKGVVVTHASVLAFVEWAVGHFGITAGERLSSHPPLQFDLSSFDLFGGLGAGAEVHLVPPATLLPRQLADYIAGAGLHQLFCVPSTMTYLASHRALPEPGFPTLKRVIWCGEVLPTPVLIEWMRRIPQASFTNLYGPTEATIASSHYTVTAVPSAETDPIPIGTACPDEEIVVVGEDGRPAPAGATGELCIGGSGLSPGYWRNPEATARAFRPDPRPGRPEGRLYFTGDLGRLGEDGLLYFVGRADTQVKSRGYRIELGEIEAAVVSLPGVVECAVVGVPVESFEGVSICCAYAAAPGTALTGPALRELLRDRLPGYMLPRRWQCLPALPKNANGKIDRRHLQAMFEGAIAG